MLGGEEEPVEALRERLESAVHSLHDPDQSVLLAVFAMNDSTRGLPTLGERRQTYGKLFGIGREAVADRDAAAIERLLHQLLTGWYPKSPVPMRIPESHNGVVDHEVHLSTLVRDRRHVLTRHRYRLMVTFDGARYTALAMTYPSLPEITLGEWTVQTVEAANGVVHQFWHDTPMGRGQTYDLGFVVRNPNPDEPQWLTEESLAFHEPTRSARFEVLFEGAAPERVWAFSGLTGAERPGGSAQQTDVTRRGDRAGAEFRDLHGGLWAGVAWKWPT